MQTISTSNKPKINIKKFYDDMEIIDSGVIHSFNSSDIIININSVQVYFKFISKAQSKEEKSKIDLKVDKTKNNTLIVSLINFENPNSEGSPKPINIAKVGESQIFISFFVETINKSEGIRSFLYTIMAKE